MDLRSVREGDEILPGIGVVEMPGHSPGSIGVTVETEDGLAVITGDALHFAGVALTKRNPLVFWDPEEAAQSIERVVAMADVLYPGHDQPFSVTKDGEIDYRHRPTMTFVGVEPGTDGVDFQGGPVIAEPWVMPGIEQQRSLFAAFRAADEAGRDALELGGERPAHQHRPDVDRRGHAAGHRHAH
jgi:glyoxylase-like metal-dependent hydrolase (beta-lactamase superfamily II)